MRGRRQGARRITCAQFQRLRRMLALAPVIICVTPDAGRCSFVAVGRSCRVRLSDHRSWRKRRGTTQPAIVLLRRSCRRRVSVAERIAHGPVPQRLYLLGHHHRKRPGAGQCSEDAGGVQPRIVGVGVVQRADDGLFDLGAGEAVAGGGQRFQLEACRVLFAPAQVDGERLAAGLGVGAKISSAPRRNSAAGARRRWQWRPEHRRATARSSGPAGAEHAAADATIAVGVAGLFVSSHQTTQRHRLGSGKPGGRSVSPWYLLYSAPKSRRNSGMKPPAQAAASDLPVPCTPSSSTRAAGPAPLAGCRQ